MHRALAINFGNRPPSNILQYKENILKLWFNESLKKKVKSLSYVLQNELLSRYLNYFKTFFAHIFFITVSNFSIRQSSRFFSIFRLFFSVGAFQKLHLRHLSTSSAISSGFPSFARSGVLRTVLIKIQAVYSRMILHVYECLEKKN